MINSCLDYNIRKQHFVKRSHYLLSSIKILHYYRMQKFINSHRKNIVFARFLIKIYMDEFVNVIRNNDEISFRCPAFDI